MAETKWVTWGYFTSYKSGFISPQGSDISRYKSQAQDLFRYKLDYRRPYYAEKKPSSQWVKGIPGKQSVFILNEGNLTNLHYPHVDSVQAWHNIFTLQETNISPKNGILKMIFLFPRWDMLIPWRVPPKIHLFILRSTKRSHPTAASLRRFPRCSSHGFAPGHGKGGRSLRTIRIFYFRRFHFM